MNPLLVAPLLELGSNLIGRLFPDPQQKAAAELELLKLTQDGDLKKILGQLEINAKEAAHPSVFVAGWRPAVGWTCGFGLAYQSVFHNILAWLSTIYGWPLPPAINSDVLIYTLSGMLGIGALRTFEKVNKVTK